MGFVLFAILCLNQWVDFTTFVLVRSSAQISLKKISNVAVRKENSMNWDEAIYRRRFSLSLKCGNVSGGVFTRQPLMLNYISDSFPYSRSLTEHQLLEEIKKGNLVGYVQCDLEDLRRNFAKFPPIFKNTLISKNAMTWLNRKVCRRRKYNISTSENVDIKFPHYKTELWLLFCFFYLQLGLFVTKTQFCWVHSRKNVSMALYRQQWTQEGKVTKIPIQMSLRRQWSC